VESTLPSEAKADDNIGKDIKRMNPREKRTFEKKPKLLSLSLSLSLSVCVCAKLFTFLPFRDAS